jgi:hypothetical protein
MLGQQAQALEVGRVHVQMRGNSLGEQHALAAQSADGLGDRIHRPGLGVVHLFDNSNICNPQILSAASFFTIQTLC